MRYINTTLTIIVNPALSLSLREREGGGGGRACLRVRVCVRACVRACVRVCVCVRGVHVFSKVESFFLLMDKVLRLATALFTTDLATQSNKALTSYHTTLPNTVETVVV